MCKTIKHKVKFRASPDEIYAMLADSRRHSALTGLRAEISKKVGGNFSTRGGHVTGVNVELVPGVRIVQAWRSREFPEGIFSMATVLLSPTNRGGTELVLTHRGVPKSLIPKVEAAWRRLYWDRIRGLQMEK